jgi:hypothetical protein
MSSSSSSSSNYQIKPSMCSAPAINLRNCLPTCARTWLQVTLTNLKHVEQSPTQVYQLPATSNMEYGFFSSKQLVSAQAPCMQLRCFGLAYMHAYGVVVM